MNQKLKGGLFVFVGASSFGMLSTIIKRAYEQGYTVGQVTGTQTMFGMLLLWAIYLIQKYFFDIDRKTKQKNEAEGRNTKTAWWKLCLAGIFTGMTGMFYYQCINLLPASIAIILLMQYLWISILVEAIVFKKRPHKMQVIAACIVFVGTIFAGGIFNESIMLNVKGIAFGFLSAISYSIFLMTSGRIGVDFPVFKKSALMLTGSMILTWIVFPPMFLFDGMLIGGGLYKWGLIVAIIGGVIPQLFFAIGIPKVGVSLAAILSAAELPVAVMSSSFILREHVDGLQWFGVGMILVAIGITNIKIKKLRNSLPDKELNEKLI